MKTTVIVSGYFNPLHKGHLEYFETAKKHGDSLVVIVNSDLQRELKGSAEFQDQFERMQIIESLRIVDEAVLSIDKDRTVNETLRFLKSTYGKVHKLVFANGGDQNNQSIPEAKTCAELEIEMIDGLGQKIQSSSWLLQKQ